MSCLLYTSGAEQEYFLIDKEKFKQRKDLVYTGRTLFGAMPPKGQEMDDHYLGTIRQRVSAYMKEVNEECWKLGVSAKTQHNEVAPAQHEPVSYTHLVYKKNGEICIRSGAGIVADSVPEKEFMECKNKAKAVVRALAQAEEGIQ